VFSAGELQFFFLPIPSSRLADTALTVLGGIYSTIDYTRRGEPFLIAKVKVKVTLEQPTKAQRGEYRYISTLSLTSALNEGGGPTPRPGRLPPPPPTGKDPGTSCIGGWISPTGIRCPYRPARSAVAIPTELSRPTTSQYDIL
jgi:hypothetical protein